MPFKTVWKSHAVCRQLDEDRLKHVLQCHPYERFPIDRIENAVAAIPKADFAGAQENLLGFGEANIFW